MPKFFATCLYAVLLAALAVPEGAAEEQPKWFVLRDHELGLCWTALLIKVGGYYRHGVVQTAGGPYDTEAQVLERRKALQESGTCVS